MVTCAYRRPSRVYFYTRDTRPVVGCASEIGNLKTQYGHLGVLAADDRVSRIMYSRPRANE